MAQMLRVLLEQNCAQGNIGRLKGNYKSVNYLHNFIQLPVMVVHNENRRPNLNFI